MCVSAKGDLLIAAECECKDVHSSQERRWKPKVIGNPHLQPPSSPQSKPELGRCQGAPRSPQNCPDDADPGAGTFLGCLQQPAAAAAGGGGSPEEALLAASLPRSGSSRLRGAPRAASQNGCGNRARGGRRALQEEPLRPPERLVPRNTARHPPGAHRGAPGAVSAPGRQCPQLPKKASCAGAGAGRSLALQLASGTGICSSSGHPGVHE